MLSAAEVTSLLAVGCKSALLTGVFGGYMFLHKYNLKTRILPVMALFLMPTLFGSLLHYLHFYEPYGDYMSLAVATPALWFFFALLFKLSPHVSIGHLWGSLICAVCLALAAVWYSAIHKLGLAFAIIGLIVFGAIITLSMLSYYHYTLLGVLAYLVIAIFGAAMIVLLFYGPAMYDEVSETLYVGVSEIVQVCCFAALIFIGWFGYVPATLTENDELCGTADVLDYLNYVLTTNLYAPALKEVVKPTE